MARRVFDALSYLALWPGLYVSSGVIFVVQMVPGTFDGPRRSFMWCLSFSLCTAVGTYLLDRVKLRDAWLDPADNQAHPARYSFIASHAPLVRISAFVLVLSAMVIAATQAVQPWIILIPVASSLGVLLYAARPRRRRARLKDVLALKNAYVSGGIACFCAFVAWSWFHDGLRDFADRWPTWAFVTGTLAARVFADAVLCDLDDEAADRQFGTATFPTTFGRMGSWNGALLLRLTIAGSLLIVPLAAFNARMAWASVTAISSIALRIAKPRKVRDLVDVRFFLEACAVAVYLTMSA